MCKHSCVADCIHIICRAHLFQQPFTKEKKKDCIRKEGSLIKYPFPLQKRLERQVNYGGSLVPSGELAGFH